MLRPDTQELWDILKSEKSLGGFVLIGGTALTMHLNHRISEHLDFTFCSDKLPIERIKGLKRILAAKGWDLVPNDSPIAIQEFEDSGLELHDYHQDYIAAGKVKLTFAAFDPEATIQLNAPAPDHPRVASIEEIFRLKCIACANRSKSRDWLDLYLLLKRGYFQPIDIRRPFDTANVISKYDLAIRRMCSGRLDPGDEGFETLLSDAPSLDDMREYFLQIRDEIEIEVAKMAREKSDGTRQRF